MITLETRTQLSSETVIFYQVEFSWCFPRVTIAVIKHDDLKQFEEEISESSQRQELMQRPWRSAAYWLAPCGLLACFLIEPRTTISSGMAAATASPI